MAWTDEEKTKVVKMYKDANPTPETSIEIVNKIAEETGASANGVRMVLIQSGEYIKKEAATAAVDKDKGTAKEGTKRVSKEDSITALKAAIEAKGGDVDEDILSKLTGKAAVYFTAILSK